MTSEQNPVAEMIARISHATGGEAEFVGCTEAEVQRMIDANGTFAPDAAYLDFLRKAGRWAGGLLTGTDIFYPACLDAPEGLQELPLELISALEPVNELFVFAHHQGYQYYFFRYKDPAVYLCDEGILTPPRTSQGATFAEFLRTHTDSYLYSLAGTYSDPRLSVPLRFKPPNPRPSPHNPP